MSNNSTTTPSSREGPGLTPFDSKFFSCFLTLTILLPSLSLNTAFLVVLFRDPFKKFRTTSTGILACWFATNVVQVLPKIAERTFLVFSASLPEFFISPTNVIFSTYTIFLNGVFLTFISVDNYLLISRPLTYSNTMSKKRVRGIIGVFIFLGLCSVFVYHSSKNMLFVHVLALSLSLCFFVTLFAVPTLQFASMKALKRQRRQIAELDPTQRTAKEVFVKCQKQLLLGLAVTFIFLVLVQIAVGVFIFLAFKCPSCFKIPWLHGTLVFFLEVGVFAPGLFKPLFLALRVSSYRNAFADVFRRVIKR